jgi:transcription termination/antitermination protein NusA
MIDIKKIESAINQVGLEKKISKEKLIEIIEAAIKIAYKKDFGNKDSEVQVRIDLENGNIEVGLDKVIVEEVTDPETEISYESVGGADSEFSIGDVIEIDVTEEVMSSEGFGRIASQAARQVIIQKIQETEKEKIYNLFRDKEGEIVSLRIELVEKNRVIFDYNGNQVVLPKSEQSSKDHYVPGSRMYLYVAKVESDGIMGPRVVLTRKDKDIVNKLFEMNVPELEDGTVEIVALTRVPGVKTKLVVATEYDEVDPAGSLIGPKGIRVRAVVDELFGEKIDIINYTPDMRDLAKAALVPGEIQKIEINEENKMITAYVTAEEKPKILGKGGVNINLATDLLGYKIILEVVESPVDPTTTPTSAE